MQGIGDHKAVLVAHDREGVDSRRIELDRVLCVAWTDAEDVLRRIAEVTSGHGVVVAVILFDAALYPHGMAFLKLLRRHPALQRTPLVALATPADEPHVAAARDAGINSVMVRPRDATLLRERLVESVHYWVDANHPASD